MSEDLRGLDLSLDPSFLSLYSGPKQARALARAITEDWVTRNMYCPNCLEEKAQPEKASNPLVDFRCPKVECGQRYQLKAQKEKFGPLVRDAAYRPWIESIENGTTPNLLLMRYDLRRLKVEYLEVIPSFFIRASVLRSWLLSTRPHYEMCSIHIAMVGPDARIKLVEDGKAKHPREVQERYRSFAWMRHVNGRTRGWTADVLRCIRQLKKTEFTLQEVYSYENELRKLHPENRFVKPKIRQQLQILRDRGFLEFSDRRGRYSLPNSRKASYRSPEMPT